MHRSSLTTPDGVPLAVYEAGDPAGPEILFIHGFSQSALSWLRQMTSATLARFRRIPGARLSVYEGAGHCTFREASERFDAELAGLVDLARRR